MSSRKYKFADILGFKVFSRANAKDKVVEYHSIEDINLVVQDAIAVSMNKKVKDINLDDNLTKVLKLDNYELSYINHVLKENFGINAWTDIWETAETPKDIIKIAEKLCNQSISESKDLTSRHKNALEFFNKAVTGRKVTVATSRVLLSKRASKLAKSAAGSALSQRKAPAKVTAASAASKVLRGKDSSKSARTLAGSALTQRPNRRK